MKQVQIVLSIVLTLALCYGAVLAFGDIEAGDRSNTAGVEPVIAGGAFVSQSIINATNTTENATRNATFEGPDPLPGRTAMPHDAAPVQQTSGGGGGGGGGPQSGPAPTAIPAANVTGNMTATPTGGGSSTSTPTPTSTPAPTSTPTPTSTVDVTPTTTPPAPTPTSTWTIAYHHDYEKNAFQYVIPDWERDTAHIIVEFDLRTPCSSHEAFLREAGDLGEMMYDELRSSPAGQRGNISVSEFQTFDGRRIDSSRELIVERLTFVYGYEDLMACSCTEMDGLTGAGFSGPRGVYKYRQIWWMTMQHTFPPGPIYYKLALYVYETAPEWMPPLPEPVPTAIPMFGRDSPTDPLPSWVNAPPVGEQTLSPTPTPPREPTLEVTAEPAPELTLELTAEPTSPWLSPLPTLERDAPPRPTPTPARPHELRTEPTIGETPIPVEAPEMTVAVTPVGTPEVTHEVFLEADIGASSGMTVEEPTPAEGENETV